MWGPLRLTNLWGPPCRVTGTALSSVFFLHKIRDHVFSARNYCSTRKELREAVHSCLEVFKLNKTARASGVARMTKAVCIDKVIWLL
jgi:hypothetical protein